MPRKQIPRVSMAQAIEDFISHLPPGTADKTIKAKRATLAALCRVLPRGEHTATRRLADHHVRDAILDLATGASDAVNAARVQRRQGRRTGRGPAALKQDRCCFRQFARHLQWRGWVPDGWDPMYQVTAVAKADTGDVAQMRQRRHVPEDQWPALLDAAAHPRDRAIVACGLWWARRASDLAAMQWRHIDGDEVQLVNFKAGRIGARLPIGAQVGEEIARYRAWYVAHYGEPCPDDPLFPAKVPGAECDYQYSPESWPLRPGAPTAARNITDAVRKVLAAFGWTELHGEGGHTLRRSGIRFWEYHGDLSTAQYVAGHKSQEMTRHYAGNAAQHRQVTRVLRPADPPSVPAPQPQPQPEPAPQVGVVIDMFTRRKVA